MSEDHVEDPGREATQKLVRTLLMTAAVSAEQVARLRRQQQQRDRMADEHQAQAKQQQYAGHRSLALAELDAADDHWFAVADPEQVAEVWQTAATWRYLEPETFGPPADRLRTRIRDRFGIDVDQLPNSSPHADGLPRQEGRAARAERARQERADGADRGTAAAVAGTAGLDRHDDEAEHAAQQDGDQLQDAHRHQDLVDDAAATASLAAPTADGYDTDARRAALGRRAADAGVPAEAVDARVRAATAQGRPVREATTPQRARPRPRSAARGSGRTRGQQLDR